jgi:uncharacterized protein YcfJ
MNRKLQAMLAACGIAFATHAAAQITFYEGEGFHGRAFTTNDRVWNFQRNGFNDRASSVVVDRGRWLVCEHARFEGRCVVLRHGRYPSLREIGMNDMISSVRRVEPGERVGDEAPPAVVVVPQYEPPRPVYVPSPPVAVVPYPEPRPAFYDIPVMSVHAVAGPPSQRCWMEREQVAQPANEPNIGGALLGGIVGGVLGHQIGGGTGKDVATAGGAIAGAAIGANVNRANGVTYADRDVQRCQTVNSAQPAYWDVTYSYRGAQRRVQMPSDPGPTVRVDAEGNPLRVAR